MKTPEARLRFYASQFNLVEVDTSYYAIPADTTVQHWVERTPPGFVCNVKAFSLFTGQGTNTDVLPKDLRQALGPGRRVVYKDISEEVRNELCRRFVDCLAPLKINGKLGLVHFQFAPKVVRHPAGYEREAECHTWLRMQKASHLSWLAVDGRSWRHRPFCKSLFLTDGRTGLSTISGELLVARLLKLF